MSTWTALAYTACYVAACAVPLSLAGYAVIRWYRR